MRSLFLLPHLSSVFFYKLDNLIIARTQSKLCGAEGVVDALEILNGVYRVGATVQHRERAARATLFDLHNKLLAVQGFQGRSAERARPFTFSYGRVFQW